MNIAIIIWVLSVVLTFIGIPLTIFLWFKYQKYKDGHCPDCKTPLEKGETRTDVAISSGFFEDQTDLHCPRCKKIARVEHYNSWMYGN